MTTIEADRQFKYTPGIMLARSEVDESEHEAKANSHEAEAKIALMFQPNLTFDPIFSQKRNFWSICDGTSKI